jgi:hypothetical protein
VLVISLPVIIDDAFYLLLSSVSISEQYVKQRSNYLQAVLSSFALCSASVFKKVVAAALRFTAINALKK